MLVRLLHAEVFEPPDVLLLQHLEPLLARREVGNVFQDLLQQRRQLLVVAADGEGETRLGVRDVVILE